MKKLLAFITGITILIILFAGCKKTNEPAPQQNYIRFTIDGVPVECKAYTYASIPQNPDVIISISGNYPGGSIELKLTEGSKLTAKQYLFEPFTSRSGEIWTSGPTGRHYSAGSGSATPNVDGSGQITITEISAGTGTVYVYDGYVKGTFEFTTAIDIPTNTFKTVTAGEFYVKRG